MGAALHRACDVAPALGAAGRRLAEDYDHRHVFAAYRPLLGLPPADPAAESAAMVAGRRRREARLLEPARGKARAMPALPPHLQQSLLVLLLLLLPKLQLAGAPPMHSLALLEACRSCPTWATRGEGSVWR